MIKYLIYILECIKVNIHCLKHVLILNSKHQVCSIHVYESQHGKIIKNYRNCYCSCLYNHRQYIKLD